MDPCRVLVVQHQASAPAGQLAPALSAAGLHADIRGMHAGATLPRSATELAGLVVLGGSMAAWEDARAPHLPAVRALIADAQARDVPVLAVCLGAQIAADALGGTAGRGLHGFEVGWTRLRGMGEDPVARALGEEGGELLLWHQDTFAPPPGAVSLLTGGREYAEQGFRLGSVWALQPHPEVDAAILAGWCDEPGSDAELADAGTTRDELLDRADERAAAGRRLLEAWAAEVARAQAPSASASRRRTPHPAAPLGV